MLDLIASNAIRAFSLIFYVTPIRFNLWLGRNLGSLAYFVSGKRARITYANLKAAFSREKTPKEIKRITKGVFRHVGEILSEIISMRKVIKRYVEKYITVRNMPRIEEASKNPGGMILVSAHFGNWEYSIATSAIKGYRLHVLARDQKMERVNELLNKLREAKGSTVVRKGMDVKKIFRLLHEGKSIGLLADQTAGNSGKLLDFFGRPASTAVGPYRFAQQAGAWVLPAFMHRSKGPYHELVLEEPMVIGKKEDITPYMEKYNALLEKHIRAYPEQWFWMHKKWKLTPVKKILVLDDGKKGHLKQSLAVLKQVKRYREKEGYAPENVQVETVGIRFKNKIAKGLFNAASPFFSYRCQGCLKCLKAALDEESYLAATSCYADVVISSGSTLFGVNKMLKLENNARNVTVLDPGRMNRKSFNLIVMPKHDVDGVQGTEHRVQSDNIIVTELAPNLIEPEELNTLYSGLSTLDKGKPRIGLLFGGDNKHFVFTEKLSRLVADGVLSACEKINGKFYATTSRRTPLGSEAVLKEKLEKSAFSVKFVTGREDKDPETVEKILSSSNVVVVSGESISMVSEAVSSEKKVIVFMPDKKKNAVTKYERFVKNLELGGYVKITQAERLAEAVIEALGEKKETVPPRDNERIYEKMYRLF